MLALAQARKRDTNARAANDDDFFGGPRTRTKFSYDVNGNLTSDGGTTFGYDAENRLTSATGAKNATLIYDPDGRLSQVSGSTTTRFLYDGDKLIAEYNANGALVRRYVHGAGTDEALLQYEGAGVDAASRRYLHSNNQGSVIAVANAAGATVEKENYDSYGVPGSLNSSRFQYTGQTYISEVGLYYYKARFYNPSLGRFMQVDPVGYKDDVNLYAYAGNDPFNKNDPSGLCKTVNNVITECAVVILVPKPAGDTSKGKYMVVVYDPSAAPAQIKSLYDQLAKVGESIQSTGSDGEKAGMGISQVRGIQRQ